MDCSIFDNTSGKLSKYTYKTSVMNLAPIVADVKGWLNALLGEIERCLESAMEREGEEVRPLPGAIGYVAAREAFKTSSKNRL